MRVERAERRCAEPCTGIRPNFAQFNHAARPSCRAKPGIWIVEQHEHEQRSRHSQTEDLAVTSQRGPLLRQPLGLAREAEVEKREQREDEEAEVAVVEVAGILIRDPKKR